MTEIVLGFIVFVVLSISALSLRSAKKEWE
jgi:hypothetical protein